MLYLSSEAVLHPAEVGLELLQNFHRQEHPIEKTNVLKVTKKYLRSNFTLFRATLHHLTLLQLSALHILARGSHALIFGVLLFMHFFRTYSENK